MTFRQFIFAPAVCLAHWVMSRNPMSLVNIAQRHASNSTGYWSILQVMRAKNIVVTYEILWLLMEMEIARGRSGINILGMMDGVADVRGDVRHPITQERSDILARPEFDHPGDLKLPIPAYNDYWIGRWLFSGRDEYVGKLAAVREDKTERGWSAVWAFNSLYNTCQQFKLAADRLGLKPMIEAELSAVLLAGLGDP